MSSELALLACGVLLTTAIVGLFSKKVTVSLIMLFYSSLTLGVIFTLYGSVLVGLLHIITFAGAVSVMLLSAVLMTGESSLDIRANLGTVSVVGAVLLLVAVASFRLFSGLPGGGLEQGTYSPQALLQFIWQFRPWDLLILLMVFASSMIAVVNLFSKEEP